VHLFDSSQFTQPGLIDLHEMHDLLLDVMP